MSQNPAYIMEYYSAIKRNEVLICTIAWMAVTAPSRGEECEHDKSGKRWTNYKQFSAYEGQVENSSLVK